MYMKYLVCLILILGFAATAFAEEKTVFGVVLKSGNELTWQSLFLDGDSVCTHISGGVFCVSKTDVASYKEIKVIDPTGPTFPSSASPSSSDGQGRREGEASSGGTFTGRARALEKLIER
jgi:hypothetical protein